jgi:hypothetical protein
MLDVRSGYTSMTAPCHPKTASPGKPGEIKFRSIQ